MIRTLLMKTIHDYLYYISNMYIADVEGENGEADKGLMVMDRTLNGEVIWKFDNLKPVTKFLMTFKGQAVKRFADFASCKHRWGELAICNRRKA